MSSLVRCKSDYTLLAIPRQPPASKAECSNPGETGVPPTLRHGKALTSSKYFTGKQKFQWDQIPLKSHNRLFLYINLIFYMNFICFGYSGSSLLCRLFSSWDERGLISSCSSQAVHYRGFSCCRARALGHSGFSSCDPWALEHRLSSLAALWQVGSSQTRDPIRVSCIGRQILFHWATREALTIVSCQVCLASL